MNLFQKIAAWFGVQYVLLEFYDGRLELKRAYTLGGKVFADPYLPCTRVQLLPGGRCKGQCYVRSWIPVTERTFRLYGKADVVPIDGGKSRAS